MNTYKVSLAVNVPFNWEIEVEAQNDYDAFLKAEATFNMNYEQGMLKDTECAVTLDLTDEEEGIIPAGASVEKI